jgi:RNA polymerase sigma-70 factor (ECF subfamily)
VSLEAEPTAEPTAEPNMAVVNLDERQWLARHCRGDREAFTALMNAYQAPVYGYLVRCGVPPASRDDVFQEIFVKIHLAAASYQPSRPLRPWLFTIAANSVRNHFRDESRHRVAGDTQAGNTPSGNHGPRELAEIQETVAWLEGALPTLPLAQREVLLLGSIAGLRLQDIATVLGIPLNTVKTLIRRARASLARALTEHASGTAGGSS